MKIPATALRRIERLEAAKPVETKPPSPWPMIAMSCIAFHLGAWNHEKDSVAEACGRAIGWITADNPNSFAMARAMSSGEPLFYERHQDALRRMFAARGVALDGDEKAW
jgi:hypothetical protein